MNDLTTDQLVTLLRALDELGKGSLYARMRSGHASLDYVIGAENKDLHEALELRPIIQAELEKRKAAK